jgi:hypothetical protein
MIYVLAVIAGIVGAVAGYLITATVAVAIAGLFGMSDFEGGRGMFGAFVAGPIGGLIAMIASVWLAFRIGKGAAPLGPTLARVGVVLATIGLLVAAGIVTRIHMLDVYTDTLPPTLEFEIRVPATMAAPDPAEVRVELHTDRNVGEAQLFDDWSRTDDGYRVIKGAVPLAFKTSSRLLVVSFPAQPTRLFRLPLSRDPSSTATLGSWQRAAHIDIASEGQPRPSPPGDPMEIRYRVRRAGE